MNYSREETRPGWNIPFIKCLKEMSTNTLRHILLSRQRQGGNNCCGDKLTDEVRQESPWTAMFADDTVICSESREQVYENLPDTASIK